MGRKREWKRNRLSLCDSFVGTEGSENKQHRITNIRHGERFCPTNHHCRDASRFLMIVSEENAVNARMGTIRRQTDI
jgi:hypothetical protein